MRKWDRNAGRLINLTDHTINVYDVSTGEIICLEPLPSDKREKLLNVCRNKTLSCDRERTHYVVSVDDVDEIRDENLSRIAIAYSTAFGRGHTQITKLLWGVAPSVEVRFYSSINI